MPAKKSVKDYEREAHRVGKCAAFAGRWFMGGHDDC